MIDVLFDIELTYDVVISPMFSTSAEWNTGAFSIMPIYEEISRQGLLI